MRFLWILSLKKISICGVTSGAILFSYVPLKGRQVRLYGLKLNASETADNFESNNKYHVRPVVLSDFVIYKCFSTANNNNNYVVVNQTN